MTDTETLQYLINNGIIDMAYMQEQAERMKRQELLDKNPWKIYQGKDGSYYAYLPDDKNSRKRIKRKDKKELEDIIISYWKTKVENPTIEEVFNEWNDRRLNLKQIAPGTHERNKQIFNRHYSSFKTKRIKSVSPEEFEEFLEEQIPEHNLTSKAFSGLKSITKGFLKRARKRKLIDFHADDVFSDLDTSESSFKKNKKKDEEEVFSDAEVREMLSYIIDSPDIRNLGILLMFLTGLRVGELVALRFDDIQDNVIRVTKTETRYKKDGKTVYEIKESPKTDAGDRRIIIPENYLWIIKRLRNQNPFSEYIFTEKGKRFTTNVIRRRLYSLCEKLEIPPRSPHKIRKTYASILSENQVDAKMIEKMMGHTDISCTRDHYIRNRKSTEQMAAVVNNIQDFKAM